MAADRETMDFAIKERFSRITPQYILVYTTKQPPQFSVAITPEDMNRLREGDRQWITDCLLAEAAALLKAREPELLTTLSTRVTALEQALRQEAASAWSVPRSVPGDGSLVQGTRELSPG